MKKILLMIMMLIVSINLIACQLAESAEELEDDYSNDSIYYPVALSFYLFDDQTGERINVSDYLYFTWQYNVEGLDFNRTSTKTGTSMRGGGIHTSYHDDETTGNKTLSIDADFDLYISTQYDHHSLYATVLYRNVEGKEKEEIYPRYQLVGSEGLGFGFSYNWEIKNNLDTFILDLAFQIVMINSIDYIEIKEYNDQDEMIKTSMITPETLLETFEKNEETIYIVIVEHTENGDSVSEDRLFYSGGDPYFYTYKFINEDGFIGGEYLVIE